jgi:hypothetical protein
MAFLYPQGRKIFKVQENSKNKLGDRKLKKKFEYPCIKELLLAVNARIEM